MSANHTNLYFVSLLMNRDFWSCISPLMFGSKQSRPFRYYENVRVAVQNGYVGLFKTKNPNIPSWRIMRYYDDIACSGNLPLLQLCMQSVLETENRSEFFFCMYGIAVKGHHHILVWLFENKLCYRSYEPILLGAVDGGHVNIVEWILGYEDALDKHELNDYKILLSKAAQQGNLQLVKFFYEKYSSLQESEPLGTPFIYDALRNDRIDVAAWLIKLPALFPVANYEKQERELIRTSSLESIKWYETHLVLGNPLMCAIEAVIRGDLRILKLITESRRFKNKRINQLVRDTLTGQCVKTLIMNDIKTEKMHVFRYLHHKYRVYFLSQPEEVVQQAYAIATENCDIHPKFMYWICSCFRHKIPVRTILKIPLRADDRLVKTVVHRDPLILTKDDLNLMLRQLSTNQVVANAVVDHAIKQFDRSELYRLAVGISSKSSRILGCVTKLYFFLTPPTTEDEFRMTATIIHNLYSYGDLSVKILRQIVHS